MSAQVPEASPSPEGKVSSHGELANKHSDSLNSLACYKPMQGSLHCNKGVDLGEQLTKGLGQKVTKSAVPSHTAHPFSVPSHTCIHVNGTRSDSSRGTVVRSLALSIISVIYRFSVLEVMMNSSLTTTPKLTLAALSSLGSEQESLLFLFYFQLYYFIWVSILPACVSMHMCVPGGGQ